jgi:hypothetical protein
MRHLDFGFPGNQSVLNPRLLKSVSIEDNLSRGPLNQGNSSALRYELQEGDPENITGDIVFGTINRELNATFYWDSTTFIASYRNLQPTFLGTLGKQFFTLPKETRIGETCPKGQICKKLEEPIEIGSQDGLLSVFNRRASGGFWRFLFLGMQDDFEIEEDVSGDFAVTLPIIVQRGQQSNLLLSYDGLAPFETGELVYSLTGMFENKENESRDTSDRDDIRFYNPSGSANRNIMGLTTRKENTYTTNFAWTPLGSLLGYNYSYGVELNYVRASGKYRDFDSNPRAFPDVHYVTGNGLFRVDRAVRKTQKLQASVGWHSVDVKGIYPLASARYTVPFGKIFSLYGDASLRQNTITTPTERNRISPVTTGSLEGKLGFNGNLGRAVNYAGAFYSRYYLEPTLPVPDVYWHYRERREADYAAVFGTSLNVAWEPVHHFAMNLNGSIVQGDYYLSDGTAIPWEANRTLDLVSNIRVVPRRDSLLSMIMTYTVNNGIPLYEYEIPLDRYDLLDIRERKISASRDYPEISRQRFDARINLNLKSKWKPLETAQFFFQGNNIFSIFDNEYVEWLGGKNQKQRGWTRLASGRYGDLTPMLIRGIGFFWMPISFSSFTPFSVFVTRIRSCTKLPTGAMSFPPTANCSTRGRGIEGGAAVIIMTSKGACSFHPA